MQTMKQHCLLLLGLVASKQTRICGRNSVSAPIRKLHLRFLQLFAQP
jgi:hypothetical protein